MPDNPRTIGSRLFTDGITRPVFADDDGCQFVLDQDGQAVSGVWILTEDIEDDEPIVLVIP